MSFVFQEFRLKAFLAKHLATAHGLAIRPGSPRPVMKTRAAFCLITTPLTRTSRQVCADILQIRRAARQPVTHLNIALIKQECKITVAPVNAALCVRNTSTEVVFQGQTRLSAKKLRLRRLVPRKRFDTNRLAVKIGVDLTAPKPDILAPCAPAAPRDPSYYRYPHRDPEISEPNIAIQFGLF